MAKSFQKVPDVIEFTGAAADVATEIKVPNGARFVSVYFDGAPGKVAIDGTDKATIDDKYIPVPANKWFPIAVDQDAVTQGKGPVSVYVATAAGLTPVRALCGALAAGHGGGAAGAFPDKAPGTDVIGDSTTPAVLGVDTYEVQGDWTDARGYRAISHLVSIPVWDAATTLITVLVEWSDDETALHPQGVESVAAGIITLTPATFTYAISGIDKLPPIPLPVAAQFVRVSVKADLGTTTEVYVRAVRLT